MHAWTVCCKKKFARSVMELARACRYGDVDACREICSRSGDSIAADEGHLSALHWVLLGKNTSDEDCVAIIDILKGTGVNHKADDVALSGESQIDKVSDVIPLHLAVLYKGVSVIRKLLDICGDPDKQDSNGETPLLYACRQNEPDKVAVLLEYGANPSVCNNRGESPFSVTLDQGIQKQLLDRLNARLIRVLWTKADVEEVPILLRAHADVNCVDPEGIPALILAIRTGDYNAVIQLFEIQGMQANTCDPKSGNNALHDLVMSSLGTQEKEDILHELVFLKIDINLKNKAGKTPLDLCSEDAVLKRILVENGAVGETSSQPTRNSARTADVGDLSPQSVDPLSPSGNISTSRDENVSVDLTEIASKIGTLLVELHAARSSVETLASETPPLVAASTVTTVTEGQLVEQKMELLKKLNMYVSEFERTKVIKNKDFKTIGAFIELQKLISECRKDINQMNDRIASGNFSTSESAPPADSPTTSSGVQKSGRWFRSPDSIESDIEAYIRMIRKSTNSHTGAEGAIFEIVKRCQTSEIIPVLKLLRNRGADINFREKASGVTGLMVACGSQQSCSDELVDWMIANSAEVCMTDKIRGWTALHHAVNGGNLRVVESVLGRGKLGLVNVRDNEGRTVVDLCNNTAIRKVLQPVESS